MPYRREHDLPPQRRGKLTRLAQRIRSLFSPPRRAESPPDAAKALLAALRDPPSAIPSPVAFKIIAGTDLEALGLRLIKGAKGWHFTLMSHSDVTYARSLGRMCDAFFQEDPGASDEQPLPEIDLIDVSADEHTPGAASNLVEGLDALFRRLGPPPDHLRTERAPLLHGGGGAAE
ncbi:hypothetical protein [Nonomuraea sp. NPDC049784]|uniref:hypothetical protein n=1 Tax=Nonomuraea sp. NPDC049784 TaxID=3154361 RepID=UPI003402DBC3